MGDFMISDYFRNYTEYQRNRIKKLIAKFLELNEQNFKAKDDPTLDFTNKFLNEPVKPSWFRNDIETVKDIYDYIEYLLKNWDKQKIYIKKDKTKVLFPKDIISKEEKQELQYLIDNVKDIKFNPSFLPAIYKKIYSGEPIENLDVNYVSKKNFNFIKDFLFSIKELKKIS